MTRCISRPRVVLLVLFPLIATGLTATFAYRSIERVRIGSDEFDRALLYSGVIGDTVPAPATLSDGYLLTIAIVTETDATKRDQRIADLGKAHDAYSASIEKWTAKVAPVRGADADVVRSTLLEMERPTKEFWTLAQQQLLPLVRNGNAGDALALVLGPISQAYDDQRAIDDHLAVVLFNAQANQEARTRAALEHQRSILVVAVLLIGALTTAGAAIASRQRREGKSSGELVSTNVDGFGTSDSESRSSAPEELIGV